MKESKVRVYGEWTSYKKSKKPLAITLNGAGRGWRERDDGGDLTNVQYKPIQKRPDESPLYNKHILIKNTF
jgi:hypothetical protein